MVDEFTTVCPNIRVLNLKSDFPTSSTAEDLIRTNEECLSSIRFPHLTHLSLEGFHFNGAFLKSVIIEQAKEGLLDV